MVREVKVRGGGNKEIGSRDVPFKYSNKFNSFPTQRFDRCRYNRFTDRFLATDNRSAEQ